MAVSPEQKCRVGVNYTAHPLGRDPGGISIRKVGENRELGAEMPPNCDTKQQEWMKVALC